MQVNLLGFYRISKAIGGVQVCLNAAQNATTDRDEFGSGYSGIDLPKGVSIISGVQALAFVRQRHGLPHGDLDRIKRQQYFLKAAFHKITSAGTLLNPFKLRECSPPWHSLLVDPKLNLLSLARQFESLTSGKIQVRDDPEQRHADDQSERRRRRRSSRSIEPRSPPSSPASRARATPPTTTRQRAPAATVTVDILNGAGVARLAARNATALRGFGFAINTVDSTPSIAERTVIEYPAGAEAKAKPSPRWCRVRRR